MIENMYSHKMNMQDDDIWLYCSKELANMHIKNIIELKIAKYLDAFIVCSELDDSKDAVYRQRVSVSIAGGPWQSEKATRLLRRYKDVAKELRINVYIKTTGGTTVHV